ncbi:MAG: phosphatidate cytidylyltransferase [Candidatus Diapherotrites archaeon]|uniref:Phosphatidate cytidylyltransferase n=1 Tax=Candidatus Iainarchaeum sp. TaxID=3101447 RepID=A0A938YRH6_9ARCH|nr:phosphatidate cytidylyltransferase [Candidatus Diapherotrites archaeon]
MRKEARRQFIHFCFGSLFIAIAALQGIEFTRVLLAVVFAIGLLVSFLIKRGAKIPVVMQVVERVERDYEKRLPGKGALLFFLGAIILMLLFQEKMVVLGALCVAVYGDAASTVFGIAFGRHRIAGKKTIEGTVGGIAASFAFLQLLFPWDIALAAAVIGMLAELLPFDDNFTIPIAVAAALTILL